MDRGEVLFWSWLSIITTWALGLLDLALSNELVSAYGQFVAVTATFIGIILGAIVGLGYLFWPSEAVHEQKAEKETVLRRMKRERHEWARDKARDELQAELEHERAEGRTGFYSISLVQEPEAIRMREIRVQVGSSKPRIEQAWFYIISLGLPPNAEDATEVQLMFKYPTTNDVYPLAFIPTTGKPWIHVTWSLPPDAPEFDSKPTSYAKALILDKTHWIEKLNLEHNQPLKSFIFLFTVRGRDTLYFPSPNLISFKMPTTFRTTLLIQAKGHRLVGKDFEINAHSWDSVSVNEVRDSP